MQSCKINLDALANAWTFTLTLNGKEYATRAPSFGTIKRLAAMKGNALALADRKILLPVFREAMVKAPARELEKLSDIQLLAAVERLAKYTHDYFTALAAKIRRGAIAPTAAAGKAIAAPGLGANPQNAGRRFLN